MPHLVWLDVQDSWVHDPPENSRIRLNVQVKANGIWWNIQISVRWLLGANHAVKLDEHSNNHVHGMIQDIIRSCICSKLWVERI